MIKLQDFAKQQGVTDRAIQKHLKTYAAELDGLFQRKGPNGTWLTDEACEILRSKMKQAPAAVFEPDPRIGQLQQELADTKADFRDLLQQMKQKEQSMAILVRQNEQYRLKMDSVARLEADNELARQKAAEAEENAKKARKELVKAHTAYEGDLQKKNDKILALEAYAAACKARADFFAQPWYKRIGKQAPAVPELREGQNGLGE